MARLHCGHLVGVLACVSLVTAMLGGAAASAATLPTTEECAAPGANPPPPSFSQWPQVVLIAFENKDPNYVLPGGAHDGQGVLGNPKAKYFTQLAADCGRVVNYHAIGYRRCPTTSPRPPARSRRTSPARAAGWAATAGGRRARRRTSATSRTPTRRACSTSWARPAG